MEYSQGIIRAKDKTENTVIVTGSIEKQDAESPAYECMSYREQIEDVRQARLVYAGTKAMRKAKDKVLPQHPLEPQKKYEHRVAIAVAHNVLKETVEALVGMVFRKQPTYSDDMPAIVRGDETQTGHVSDIDMQGNALPIFARRVAENAMIDGHTWLHIDSPKPNPEVRNRAEERARPYWINVLKSQAHNWRYEVRDGRPVLTLFAYHEDSVEANGTFGEVERKRIRVLREVRPGMADGVLRPMAEGELWELRKREGQDKEEWVLIEGPYLIESDGIPVVCVYSNKTGTFESVPPLLDLTYEQIEHFRVRSEQQSSLTFSSISVPYVFSPEVVDAENNPKVKWSHDGMLFVRDENAKAGMLESSGNGLNALKEALQDIEARMTKPGLRMMRQVEGVQPNTATSEILSKAQGDASLVLFAAMLEDALNNALAIHASYRKDMETAGSVAINRDFHEKLISPEHLRVLLDAANNGKLTTDTWLMLLKDGEVLPDHFDVEEELQKLENEGASEIANAIRQLRAEPPAPDDEEAEAEAA